MAQNKRFNFRCDQAFLDAIDNWRVKQRPIPSQSEAIRILALRGTALDNYFPTILQKSLEELIPAGFFSNGADQEIYERLHSVLTLTLDKVAALENRADQSLESDRHVGHEAREKPSRDKFAPKLRQYSR
jgi:hypothetical protein